MHFICAIALYRAACVCRFTPFVEPSRWIEAKQHEKMVIEIELWYRVYNESQHFDGAGDAACLKFHALNFKRS